MRCPKCTREMRIYRRDKTYDSRTRRQYDRTTFWCKNDDVWVHVEVPPEEAEK